MMQNDNPPARIVDVLNQLLCRFGIDNKVKEMKILKSWPQVVGEALGKHSRAVSISKGNLFVEVDNSAWLTQLSHFKHKIILEFNRQQGKEVVKDIYFRLGEVSSSLLKRRKAPKRLSRARLDKKDVQWINERLEKIKDENLRKLLKRVLSKHKKAQKIRSKRGGG